MRGIFVVLGLALAPAAAQAASFDCTLPDLKPDEAVICATPDLDDADVRMVTTYDLLKGLFAMGMRGAMQDDQVAWLAERQACGADADCIRSAYDRRMAALMAIYDGIEKPL